MLKRSNIHKLCTSTLLISLIKNNGRKKQLPRKHSILVNWIYFNTCVILLPRKKLWKTKWQYYSLFFEVITKSEIPLLLRDWVIKTLLPKVFLNLENKISSHILRHNWRLLCPYSLSTQWYHYTEILSKLKNIKFYTFFLDRGLGCSSYSSPKTGGNKNSFSISSSSAADNWVRRSFIANKKQTT